MESDGELDDVINKLASSNVRPGGVSLLDDVVFFEEDILNAGRRDGQVAGLIKGRADGQLIGQRHGRSLGEEIGFYIGFVNTWLAMEDLQVKLTNMNHGGDTALTASTTCKTSAASAGKDSLKSTTPPSSQEKETQPSEQKQSLGPTRLTSTDVRSQQRYQQLVNLRDSLLAVRLNEPESEDIHDTIADIRRRFKGTMKIKGQSFIVTGGASGLGEAVVRRLVELGGKVTVFDRSEQAGKAIEQEFPDKVLFCNVDVTSEASTQAGIDASISKFGPVRGVVNCAGVATPSRVVSAKGVPHRLDQFKTVVDINLTGTFNVLRLAAAKMVKQDPVDCPLPEKHIGTSSTSSISPSDTTTPVTPTKRPDTLERGVIINVASVAAFEGQIGQAAYSASKGAVVAMTLPIARELGKFGIRTNVIAPGVFLTPMMASLPAKAQESLSKQVPYPSRLGDPSEFADCVVHLITNQYINGTCIRIDGSLRMSAM